MASTPLAARCPACHTVFRVVPDQLRVSQGWVRCGRCSEVFNATLSLVDVETGAPRAAAEVLSPRELGIEVVAAHEEPEWAHPTAAEAEARVPRDAESDLAQGPAPTPAPDSAPATSEAMAGAERIEPRFEIGPSQGGVPEAPPPPSMGDTESSAAAPPGSSDEPAEGASAVAPSFLRQAERAARWRQPRVRAGLATLGLLAVVMLLGQILLEYRDLAAARFPGIRPALESTCAALGCRVEAARAINSLAVESSGLVRIERSNIYRLQVALRNRAGIDVALPLLDLSFTDSQGRLIARKVLRPTELGVSQSTLGAGRELALQTTLQTGAGEPISGYTIELFYP
ncbi:MAG TPA: DUF3426 domain-containing protein [Rubrivivax sp.]|nr:DUF3426 domain-containing protein [Rubrivivax sp.]